MSTANPLEQLRRRMLSHATPAAFAALAEEHRRAGRLDEAIAVCRDGLSRYPTYASARVTLGRALLDSGDAESAVAELQHAVAQAPDNLAAVRALDAARAVLPAAAVARPVQVATHGTTNEDSFTEKRPTGTDGGELPDAPERAEVSTGAREWGDALDLGADGPQELGLAPDWSLPEAAQDSAAPVTSTADADSGWPAPPGSPELPLVIHADAGDDPWQVETPPPVAVHADAPTMNFVAPHLQGEEPAGIWPVPDPEPADGVPAMPQQPGGGAPVFGWSIEAPDARAADAIPALDERPPIWEAPTIDMPAGSAASAVAIDTSADPGVGDSGVWRGLFVEPISDGAAPSAFTGWDVPEPAAPAELPPWAEEPGVGLAEQEVEASAVTRTDDAGAADEFSKWAVRAPADDDTVGLASQPQDAAPMDAVATSVVALLTPGAPEPLAASSGEPARDTPAVQTADPWAGSLASALDEVFTQAGQPPASAEPPTHASPAVRAAMADAAVQATVEDVAHREEGLTPALVSLQQMLDAVRARRAALFPDAGG